ncbi:molecular chaperone [uncultured Adlercreutzia sp.]|uniref:TorD/DmsD family molecular chaperone n=1 Tax=uncultured Adlercreutzia sp. TaxID=875803 RepID=UPI0026F386A0|nr:molecular chaperone TorD family protein [uncultured Adlercreutzia sp.]
MHEKLAPEEAQAWEALLNWCGWALYHRPTEEDITNMVATRTLFAEEPFCQAAPEGSRALAAVLDGAAAQEDGVAALAREVQLDHTYLFRMTGQSRTTPYESVYRTDEAIMFGETLLDVRRYLAEAGLRLDSELNEPEDHAGLEFMLAAALLSQGRTDEARAFLSDHLLVFGPLYLANLEKRAQSGYYRAIAVLCAAALAGAAEALDAAPAESIDSARFAIGE